METSTFPIFNALCSEEHFFIWMWISKTNKFIALVFDQEEETRDDEIVISLKLFLFLLVDDLND